MPVAAMLLSGCGNRDGSEIHEAVSLVLALDMNGWKIVFTAPDTQQHKTVSHTDGRPLPARNALEESARIARGKIVPMAIDILNRADAVVLPGGLGAATTLCDFALRGASCVARPDVKMFLEEAHRRGIPIGAMCIAPTLVARCIPGATVTIGNSRETAEKIEEMGCFHADCSAVGAVTDRKNRIVTTPAYMLAKSPAEVFEGAVSMVRELETLLSSS